MNYKNKLFMTKKKAFTLIELLIVIAIIGILFIVLVSKVDFATDKAKATGVQTDFRSFQVAIESVAKENAGLATFGWDEGDTNGDRIRNSFDEGDINKDGVMQSTETWTGRKVYAETWTGVYTLTNPADANDKSAIAALEAAINKNLDPKLHIAINDDLTITMANGAQDPWDTEYHGYYITNATVDNKDRGAIVMYSNGANQEFGSEHSIANGIVTVNVPGNNVYGKDDYSIISVYTYVNGYGEIKTTTTGFSNNQGGGQAGTDGTFTPGNGGDTNIIRMIQGVGLVYTGSEEMKFISNAEFSDFEIVKINGVELNNSNYIKSEGSTIVVLNQSYLSTLENATYFIEIVSSTGIASCDFVVNVEVANQALTGGLYSAGAINMYLSGDKNAAKEMIVKTWDELVSEGIVNADGSCGSVYDYDIQGFTKGKIEGELVIPSTVDCIDFTGYEFHGITGIYISDEVSQITGYISNLTLDVLYIPSDIEFKGSEYQNVLIMWCLIRNIYTNSTKEEFIQRLQLTKVEEDNWIGEYTNISNMYVSSVLDINNSGRYGGNIADEIPDGCSYWDGIPVHCVDGYLELRPDWT